MGILSKKTEKTEIENLIEQRTASLTAAVDDAAREVANREALMVGAEMRFGRATTRTEEGWRTVTDAKDAHAKAVLVLKIARADLEADTDRRKAPGFAKSVARLEERASAADVRRLYDSLAQEKAAFAKIRATVAAELVPSVKAKVRLQQEACNDVRRLAKELGLEIYCPPVVSESMAQTHIQQAVGSAERKAGRAAGGGGGEHMWLAPSFVDDIAS